jgi:starvation-inducible DNA-binding protein
MQTSFMHPPFGFALFYLRSVAPASVKTTEIYWGAVPFVCIQIVMVAIIIFPGIVSYAEFAGLTVIMESTDISNATEMIKQLVAGQEAVVKTARSIFPLVDKASDEPTADLLTQRMQIHEKNAWMLRSLLEG